VTTPTWPSSSWWSSQAKTLALRLEYDGADFAGFQRQRGGRPTIQGELERAIEEIVGQPTTIVGAGRTDAGVHATGQVASFTTESRLGPEQWMGALNARLPHAISVREVWDPGDGFHARFSATSRSYRYTIVNRRPRPAVGRQYRWHVPQALDEVAMATGLAMLLGKHDFASFAGSSPDTRTTVRTLIHASCARVDDEIVVEVTADAFLPHMVRNVVGTLAEVGRGALPPDALSDILAARDRRKAGPTAPPHGLCLVAVNYGVPL
jgi:tRNA pseudouridine38-40 synthase